MSESKGFEDSTHVPLKSTFTPDSFSNAGVDEMITSAKQAIERKELKRSIALINDILNIDTYNKVAQQLRSEIQSQLKQDIAKVRLYLSSSGQTYEGSSSKGKVYSPTAAVFACGKHAACNPRCGSGT